MHETWAAMEALVGKNLTRSIGVSNFQAQLIYDMLRYAKIPPAALQIEHHPFLLQKELLALCKNENIAVTAYSTFGPASFLEFGFKHAHALQPLMQDELIVKLAEKYSRKPSQILLRWATQRGLAVIPKTTRVPVMAENLDCTSFDMTAEDIESITAKDSNLRFNQPNNVSLVDILPFLKRLHLVLAFTVNKTFR